MSPIIETQKLTHIYSKGTPFEHLALDGVDFSVDPGEFVAVIGQTGSGKSTLIQHLNGLLQPDSGKVLFNGQDIWSSKAFNNSIRFKVGLVFQYPEYQLFEETVFKDISFGPRNMGLSPSEIEERVYEAAGFVGLTEDQLAKSPFDLSGGGKRRAAIAGVIAMRPEVLILDEPTAGLDPMGSRNLMENIRAYHRENNAAVILVTHNMEEAARQANRLTVLSGGKIVMDGTPEKVFDNMEALEKMRLDTPEITQVFSCLRRMGFDVPQSVYTVEQAKSVLLDGKWGLGNA
ncbi:MAG: energy-coupling factor transporter ATPase [Oscillospiraceae bacterium]|nr:energy-coupling factor transporter ATPase [Oscillospiraceae bacterium]